MKRRSLLALCLFAFSILYGASGEPLAPQTVRPLYEHLCEVNGEWRLHWPTAPAFWLPAAFANDTERIQAHLAAVERYLRDRLPADLDPDQRRNRWRQLDLLRAYGQAGRFPRNTGHAVRRPYFVDEYGTACAVGYLLLADGREAVVSRIRAERNFAYVRQLPYPELAAWAAENGFTQEELAWIQPGYPPDARPASDVGAGGGVDGRVNIMEKNEDESLMYLAGDFTAVDGLPARSIIAWDGDNWQTLGEGLDGEVYALAFHDSYLYAGGAFCLPGQSEACNVARWDGQAWQAMQSGPMDGVVYALTVDPYSLTIGGDFDQVDGLPVQNLASYLFYQEEWSNNDGAFAVNGPVYCFERVGFQLLVGGDFTQTAPNQPAASQLTANALAYWDGADWLGALQGPHGPVRAMAYFNGDLYVGGHLGQENGMALLRGGLWLTPFDPNFGFYPMAESDSTVHRFRKHNDEHLLVVGGFDFYQSGSFIFGHGAALVQEDFLGTGYCLANGTVRDALLFQNDTYFAGDFSEINGEPYQQLIRFEGPVSTAATGNPVADIKAFRVGDYLRLEYETLPREGQFVLFNLQGQVVLNQLLPAGQGALEIPVGELPRGAYVWQMRAGGALASGKMVW